MRIPEFVELDWCFYEDSKGWCFECDGSSPHARLGRRGDHGYYLIDHKCLICGSERTSSEVFAGLDGWLADRYWRERIGDMALDCGG